MTVAKHKGFKPKEPIPDFKSREEEAEFWDTHDLADYWNEMKPVQVTVAEGPLSVLQVQFDNETAAELFRLAEAKGVLATAMVHEWVLERLRLEQAKK
ncbi:MAG: hypothetical protein HY680_02940 [Chloroflexi bacterium]|nr:hypothetical protein [Chloroflexota bacterium]